MDINHENHHLNCGSFNPVGGRLMDGKSHSLKKEETAIDTKDDWLLHAGDAYFYRGEMDHDYHCPLGLRGYQKMMKVDRRARLRNQERL